MSIMTGCFPDAVFLFFISGSQSAPPGMPDIQGAQKERGRALRPARGSERWRRRKSCSGGAAAPWCPGIPVSWNGRRGWHEASARLSGLLMLSVQVLGSHPAISLNSQRKRTSGRFWTRPRGHQPFHQDFLILMLLFPSKEETGWISNGF